MNGIIIKGIGGFYYVKIEDGTVYECKARGIFRKDKITPMIGDRVSIDVENDKGNITHIHERKTMLLRPPVANIDKLVVVIAAGSPEPNLPLIDKMLVHAHMGEITPIICINKTDINPRNDLYETYKNAGYEVVRTCVQLHTGIDELLSHIKGSVTAFAGLSGVGKSSLLNLLTESKMETGEVSDKIQRGKHTTRHVELMELSSDSGYVLDTPGFSSLEIAPIKPVELQKYFPEVGKYENECRFRGCSHINEPNCEVIKAMDKGEISDSRYENYKELYTHLKTIKDWER